MGYRGISPENRKAVIDASRASARAEFNPFTTPARINYAAGGAISLTFLAFLISGNFLLIPLICMVFNLSLGGFFDYKARQYDAVEIPKAEARAALEAKTIYDCRRYEDVTLEAKFVEAGIMKTVDRVTCDDKMCLLCNPVRTQIDCDLNNAARAAARESRSRTKKAFDEIQRLKADRTDGTEPKEEKVLRSRWVEHGGYKFLRPTNVPAFADCEVITNANGQTIRAVWHWEYEMKSRGEMVSKPFMRVQNLSPIQPKHGGRYIDNIAPSIGTTKGYR